MAGFELSTEAALVQQKTNGERYNDARLQRRLTTLTFRASLRSDHDRWTA
jgi:hypothetical protein